MYLTACRYSTKALTMENNKMDPYLRKKLEDSKPNPTNFESIEEYDEALGYWMGHQGRILAMTAQPSASSTAPSTDSPAPSMSQDAAK